jgi:hypothetical protein
MSGCHAAHAVLEAMPKRKLKTVNRNNVKTTTDVMTFSNTAFKSIFIKISGVLCIASYQRSPISYFGQSIYFGYKRVYPA